MTTHAISIWALTPAGEFADSSPAYESDPLTEQEARQSFDNMRYEDANCLHEYRGAGSYLVSLDELDDDGMGICQQSRIVNADALLPTP